MSKEEKYLDIGNEYLKEAPPLLPDDDFKEHKKPSKNDLKKQANERHIEYLQGCNRTIERFLDEKYDFNDNKNSDEIAKFITNEGNRIYMDLPPYIQENYFRLINDEEYTKEIKDRKFQAYLQLRKNLGTLYFKINDKKLLNSGYLCSNLRKDMDRLDEYLSSYLQTIVFKANKHNIIEWVRFRLSKKRKHTGPKPTSYKHEKWMPDTSKDNKDPKKKTIK